MLVVLAELLAGGPRGSCRRRDSAAGVTLTPWQLCCLSEWEALSRRHPWDWGWGAEQIRPASPTPTVNRSVSISGPGAARGAACVGRGGAGGGAGPRGRRATRCRQPLHQPRVLGMGSVFDALRVPHPAPRGVYFPPSGCRWALPCQGIFSSPPCLHQAHKMCESIVSLFQAWIFFPRCSAVPGKNLCLFPLCVFSMPWKCRGLSQSPKCSCPPEHPAHG